MTQSTGKSDFFGLTETGRGGTITLFYGEKLHVCFWKIRIQITGSCACIVLVPF